MNPKRSTGLLATQKVACATPWAFWTSVSPTIRRRFVFLRSKKCWERRRAEKVTAFVAGLGAGNVGDAFGIIREVESTMGDLRQFARDVVGFLRDLMILKTAGSEADRLVSLPHSELAAARELAGSMGIDMILRAIEEFGAAEADMRWSPTPASILKWRSSV